MSQISNVANQIYKKEILLSSKNGSFNKKKSGTHFCLCWRKAISIIGISCKIKDMNANYFLYFALFFSIKQLKPLYFS